MHIHEALQSQHTIASFRPDPIPDDILKTLLAAGAWTSNHSQTEPWRFTILGERTKRVLAQRYADLRLQTRSLGETNAVRRAVSHARSVETFLAKPTVVVVSCRQQGDALRRREDYAATLCAIQNIQLAAWADGIGMQWSTSPIIFDAQTYTLLGIDPSQEEIIGLLYVGYPAQVSQPRQKLLSEVLRWTP